MAHRTLHSQRKTPFRPMRTKGRDLPRYHLISPGPYGARRTRSPTGCAGRSGLRCNGLTRAGLLTARTGRLSSASPSGRPSAGGAEEGLQPVAFPLWQPLPRLLLPEMLHGSIVALIIRKRGWIVNAGRTHFRPTTPKALGRGRRLRKPAARRRSSTPRVMLRPDLLLGSPI